MADFLTPEERAWLLDALAELLDARGAEAFLSAPILEPTPRDFPDPFSPDAAGVRSLLRRLLRHAGLGELELVVEPPEPDVAPGIGARAGPRRPVPVGAAAWFDGLDADGRCRFGVAEERIGAPEALVASLCREVARAWRAIHGVAVEEPAVEARLTDVTTVCLGFGLLTTGGAAGPRSCGGGCCGPGAHGTAGPLPPQAMSFLLAAQAKARGLGWLARRRLAGRLAPNPAAWFAWAHGVLPAPEELRRALGPHVAAA